MVTGFLGSGKTTLISELLRHPGMGETAVIVNELGEVALDHHLLRRVDERTVVLASGCVCCTLRGDLAEELRDLLSRRERGEIPAFRQVLVETTGLADPAPIVSTLLSDPVLRHHYVLDAVVTTVDAAHGLRLQESVKQAAVADTLVVTKVDVADPAPVEEELRRLNPEAELVEAVFGRVDPERLFGGRRPRPRPLAEAEPAHTEGVAAHSLVVEEELDWNAFAVWLTMLLQARGGDIYRIKGLLDTGAAGPVLLSCVQHAVHPPEHLDAWPEGDRRSCLVLIGRGLDRERLEASLRAFNRVARPGGATDPAA